MYLHHVVLDCISQKTKIQCREGIFCPYKTYAETFEGGAKNCDRCPPGAQTKRLSTPQMIIQWVIFVLVAVLVMGTVIVRRMGLKREKIKEELHFDKVSRDKDEKPREQAAKLEQERFMRLRPKFEVIEQRLGRITRGNSQSTYSQQNSFYYRRKNGEIVFDADILFDILDKDGDGVLSLDEINQVLCLGDSQLRAFISTMQRHGNTSFGTTAGSDKISKAQFTRGFLDALADATQLDPSPREAKELFFRMQQDIGATDSDEILFDDLYRTCLSQFLSDTQIHGIISRFRNMQQAAQNTGRETVHTQSSFKSAATFATYASVFSDFRRRKGIRLVEFVQYYPLFLGEVTHPDFEATGSFRRSVFQNDDGQGGLDVAFQNLCLTVKVGGKEVRVVDSVTGRLKANTLTGLFLFV